MIRALLLAGLGVALPAQGTLVDLRGRHLPPEPDTTTALATADVDNDGDLDLLVGSSALFQEPNRLYLGDGTGRFVETAAGRFPNDRRLTTDVLFGDVDGDGDADAVIINSGNPQTAPTDSQLLLNDGTGVFTDATAGRLAQPGGIAGTLVDVDNDADLDLVVVGPALFVNDGSGRFTDVTATQFPPGTQLEDVAAGDVDGDGDADLVWAGPNGRVLYENNGSGSFRDASAQLPPRPYKVQRVSLGDTDGDGDLDVLFCGLFERTELYLNDGRGRFVDATTSHLPIDDDRDNYTLALGDVDQDGDLDICVGCYQFASRLYVNDGTGRFTDGSATWLPRGTGSTLALTIVDVDNDRDQDLIAGNLGANTLLLNDRNQRWSDATQDDLPTEGETTRDVTLVDVDNDGDLDVVCANSEWAIYTDRPVVAGGRNSLFRNDGLGVFTDVTATHMPSAKIDSYGTAAGDVDGDGDVDLLFGARIGQPSLYVNDGRGRFSQAAAQRLPPIDLVDAVAMGDVDGDGDLDVVLGRTAIFGGATDALWLNDGTGSFDDASGQLPAISVNTADLELGDIDGDGDLDLVVANGGTLFATHRNQLYRNDGSGVFTDITATALPVDQDTTRAATLADLDNDGDLDLVFANYHLSGQLNKLYLNDGTGRFTDASANLPPASEASDDVAAGDLDGDGDLDLVFVNNVSIAPAFDRVVLNDGSARFSIGFRWLPERVTSSSAVDIGDVDGDGDNDVVIGTLGASNRMFFNLHRHLHAPFLPQIGRTFTLEFHRQGGTLPSAVAPFLTAGAVRPQPLSTAFGDWNLGVTFLGVPPLLIQPPATRVELTFDLPLDNALLGLEVLAQAVFAEGTVPTGWRLSNTVATRVVR